MSELDPASLGDGPIQRLNLLFLSGVLEQLSVAWALQLTPDEMALMSLRQIPMGEREPIIRELLEDYSRAMNDVNLHWREYGNSPFAETKPQSGVIGIELSMDHLQAMFDAEEEEDRGWRA